MKNIGLLFTCMFLLFSCKSEMEEQELTKGKPIEKVIIKAVDLEHGGKSRTTLEFNEEGTGKFKWETTDTLGIFPDLGGYQVAFPLTKINNEEANYATFEGGGWALVSGTNYSAYYPFSYNNRSRTAIPVSYIGQKQAEANNMDHFRAYDYMYAAGTTPEDGSVAFTFQHLGTLLRLHVTLPQNDEVTSIQLTSSEENTFIEEGTFDLSKETPTITAIQRSKTTTLDLGNISMTKDQEVTFYLWTAPFSLDGSLTVKIYGKEQWYKQDVTIPNFSFEAGKYNRITTSKLTVGGDVWNGETTEAVTPESDIYTIKTAAQLAWFANEVNSNGNTFAGKTVELGADIDLNNQEWAPIGHHNTKFQGTFDGKNYTISNFKVTKKHHIATDTKAHQAALFGVLAGTVTIKNLTVDNAQILYPGTEAGDYYGAAVVGTTYGTTTLEKINVTGSTIQGNNKVAGLLAHDGSSTSITITNCHVSGCTIESKNEDDGGNVGGLVGLIQTAGSTISNSSVKNCTINAINSSDSGKRANSQFVGGIIADTAEEPTFTITGCEVSGNTFNETGVSSYVTPYDGLFVGGARENVVGIVMINGKEYPVKPVTMNGKGYDTLEEAVSAISGTEATITLAAGTYTLPTSLSGLSLVIEGEDADNAEKVIIDMSAGGTPQYNAQSVTFKNLTMKRGTNAFQGLSHTSAEHYDNCIIEGMLETYASNVTVKNSKFVPASTDCYNVHIYEAGTISFEDCTFTAYKGRSVYAHADNTAKEMNISFKSCQFKSANGKNENNYAPAIRLHTESDYNGGCDGIYGTLTIEDCTNDENFNTSINGGLWVEWNNVVSPKVITYNFTKKIDGVNPDGFEKVSETAYNISNAKGMKWFNDQLVAGNNFSEITITLTDNIDMTDTPWTSTNGVSFKGTLDGNSKTISNLKVETEEVDYASLFNNFNGTVKNLTIKGSEFTAKGNGYRAAPIAGYVSGGTIEGVKIESTTVTGSQKIGGLVANIQGKTTLNNNSVTNVTLKCCDNDTDGAVQMGGLVGYMSGETTISNNTVSGITITGAKQWSEYSDASWGFYSGYFIGSISKSTLTLTGNKIEGTNTSNPELSVSPWGCQWFGDASVSGSIPYESKPSTITIDGKAFVANGIVLNEEGVYEISSAIGFKYFAGTVLTVNSDNAVTGKLTQNIDLTGVDWPAIVAKTPFTLDGNDKTISNLTASEITSDGFISVAMFNVIYKATTIKNLTVEKATITGNEANNSHGAVLVATPREMLTVNNVTVKNSTVSKCDRSSIIVTYLYFDNADIDNCVVDNCTINSIGTAGAILGMNNNNNITIDNCQVNNTIISSSEGSNKAGIFIGTWQTSKYSAPALTGCTATSSKAINASTETNRNIGREL